LTAWVIGRAFTSRSAASAELPVSKAKATMLISSRIVESFAPKNCKRNLKAYRHDGLLLLSTDDNFRDQMIEFDSTVDLAAVQCLIVIISARAREFLRR
jgi:hypothetical protein